MRAFIFILPSAVATNNPKTFLGAPGSISHSDPANEGRKMTTLNFIFTPRSSILAPSRNTIKFSQRSALLATSTPPPNPLLVLLQYIKWGVKETFFLRGVLPNKTLFSSRATQPGIVHKASEDVPKVLLFRSFSPSCENLGLEQLFTRFHPRRR